MAVETSVMAYWYNLAWQVKERVVDEQGNIVHGLIERMEDLKFDITLEKATVKKKAVAEIQKWNDERLHFEAVGEPVEIKQALTPETKAKCEALGRAMAEQLLK